MSNRRSSGGVRGDRRGKDTGGQGLARDGGGAGRRGPGRWGRKVPGRPPRGRNGEGRGAAVGVGSRGEGSVRGEWTGAPPLARVGRGGGRPRGFQGGRTWGAGRPETRGLRGGGARRRGPGRGTGGGVGVGAGGGSGAWTPGPLRRRRPRRPEETGRPRTRRRPRRGRRRPERALRLRRLRPHPPLRPPPGARRRSERRPGRRRRGEEPRVTDLVITPAFRQSANLRAGQCRARRVGLQTNSDVHRRLHGISNDRPGLLWDRGGTQIFILDVGAEVCGRGPRGPRRRTYGVWTTAGRWRRGAVLAFVRDFRGLKKIVHSVTPLRVFAQRKIRWSLR